MRIAISGTANSGKSTLLKNFLAVWDKYKTPEKTYREVIAEGGLAHSTETTTDTQWSILNFMVDEMQKHTKDSNVIYDRCPLDNLAYTLWAHGKGIEGFDKKFVDKCINITKESMRQIDIIFLLRYDPSIPIEEDGVRETNRDFIIEIDNIFAALYEQYRQNYDADIFYPLNDSPAVIELPTSIQGRVDMIAEYVTPEGDFYGEESSIFAPDKLDELEQLVRAQNEALKQEQAEKDLWKKFSIK